MERGRSRRCHRSSISDAASKNPMAPSGLWTASISAVADGECVGVVGHNGAGKSTLMHILNGGVAPDRGRLVVAGDEAALTIPRRAPKRSGCAAVFQELSLCPNLTVAENARDRPCVDPRLRLATPGRAAHPRQARRDFSGPRDSVRRSRAGPVDRPAADGRNRARLHRLLRTARAPRHSRRADLLARRAHGRSSCSPMCAERSDRA